MSLRPVFRNGRADEGPRGKSRISQELDSLRAKITDLEQLESELKVAEKALSTPPEASTLSARTAGQIKAAIETRLGYFPGYFAPALECPEILESLWHESRRAYYDNPLPGLFKEKLFACVSRHCSSPYAIVTRACNLRILGMTGPEIFKLLTQPMPASESETEQSILMLSSSPRLPASWFEAGSALEDDLLRCCILFYLMPGRSARCHAEIRRLLGNAHTMHLLSLFGFIKHIHLWLEAHPEISYESDSRVRESFITLLRSEPRLADFFRNYYDEFGQDRQSLEAEKALQASEERYRELFENAIDMIYIHDLEGNLTSVNKAAERIAGYPRAEALHMNFSQIVAPEHLAIARQMIESQIASEVPSTGEIEIISKDGRRIALEIDTRLIFRDGKPSAIQGIARDITQRRKTEEALQQANQKLESWIGELEHRTREMTHLSEMGDMLRACLSIDEAYSVIVRVAEQIFPVQAGALYAISPSRNLVEAVAVWGDASLLERVFAPDECWALRRGRIHWVEDSNVGLLCKHLHVPHPDSYLCVPMMAQSEALGILHLTQPENVPMTEAKRRLAATMAEHIAMALSNLKLQETLRSQSIRDPLTGLFNRRFMEESLELEVRRAGRNQRPLGVIMLDLDQFKHFNDTYGHEAGDTLLRELGTLLQTNIRGEDIACRYGGEEFTLILPEGSADVTLQRANLLRDAVKRMDVHHRNQALGRVTISMGVAVFPEHGRTAQALLQSADAALYRSKNEGRDRVTVAR